jgi:predicted DNA-binding transcriptional regulator AlpA
MTQQLSDIGFFRLPQIIGQKPVTPEEAERNRLDAEDAKRKGKKPNTKPKRARQGATGIFPMSRSSWWAGIAAGKYPSPKKISSRIALWDRRCVLELAEKLARDAGQP